MADTCDKPVGERPWWMSVDQWGTDSRCKCILPAGHDPNQPCVCEHGITFVTKHG